MRSALLHALSALGRRFAAFKRRSPLGVRLALATRCVRCLPIGRHHCALRSRRHAPARRLGRPRRPPDARLSQRVAARDARTLPIGRVLAGDGSTAAHNHEPSLDVRASATVVARCASLLTRQMLGALAAMILPCGACSPGFRAPSARGSRLRRSRGLWPAFGRPAPSNKKGRPGP